MSELAFNPFVSIIIPERNEASHISECIDSVLSQTYPNELMEVLIIDGMSDDGTREIVKEYEDKDGFIRLIDNPNKIVTCALNVGIRKAKGDIIVRMDAHTYYDRNYVKACVETLSKVNADNVGGPIVTLPGDNTSMAKAISLATSHPFGVGNSKFRTANKEQYVDTVAFGAFRKEIFAKVGLFDERLIRNQDIEMNSRIIRSGGKIYLNPEIKSYYYNKSTLKGLWGQNFGNGMWNVFTLSINRQALSLRHFVPMIFVLSVVIALLLSPINSIFFDIFLSIIILYASVSLLVSLKEGLKNKAVEATLLPIVFATLHLSYGIGYFWGLIGLRKFRK